MIGIKKYLFVVLLCAPSLLLGQSFFEPADSLHKGRLTGVIVTEVADYSLVMIGLNELWYKDFPRGTFRSFNDNDEWLQMDKVGHAFSAYQAARGGYEVLKWSGVKKNKALWYGGNLGMVFLTSVEVLDGFSTQWGFSWGDMGGNAAGTAVFIGQELLWEEQRFAIKLSVWGTDLAKFRPETLGSTWSERMIKDYNGQTYWLSGNISAFLGPETNFPRWVNVAVGYGGHNMLGGTANPLSNEAGYALPELTRYRQYYLSLDVDLTRIHSKSAFMRTFLGTFGWIKLPFPALEYNSEQGVQFRALHF